MPERTPLEATVTGTLDRGDYVVEKIHFQSLPGAHVAANLYRPAHAAGRLPAVLYLCGHSQGKVNPSYQANPRWFGQHGYVALALDPVQLGECQGLHHGTYREGRFDWPSRGYTPAGLEVWNAMRAIDYLQGRGDVDGERIGVTGLSGGGAISWFLAAADDRVKAAAPVCQSGSVERMAADRGTDGHCDCAFWINYHRSCWADIGALIAPRPFLIASRRGHVLWRPAGYRPVADRIRRQYAALGAAGRFDLVEDAAPHGYTPKLRQDPATGPIAVYGRGATALPAIYAALLDPHVGEIILEQPPETHADPVAAEFLGVLRVGDVPQNLALAYPRPITFLGAMPPAFSWTKDVYQLLGAGDLIRVIAAPREWRLHAAVADNAAATAR